MGFGNQDEAEVQIGRPECLFLGLSGLWRFSEMSVGSACLNGRSQIFRTVTFEQELTWRQWVQLEYAYLFNYYTE